MIGPLHRRRAFAVLIFLVSAAGFFLTYRSYNDQFDRLSRAFQIATFGDVPFRDFFDPGYFLTLYASALLLKLFGPNLLGELLLNVAAMAAGTTLAFLMARRVSQSTLWGVATAALAVAAQPRAYDYDKTLFFPLGLYLCWRYADRPTGRSLVAAATVVTLAGLFRYDSSAYIGAALFVTILVRHSGRWRLVAPAVGVAALVMCLLALPAVLFVADTAGLRDAVTQVLGYAAREGTNGSIFSPPAFSIDWSAPIKTASAWFPGFTSPQNAAAWLYLVALELPLVSALLVLRQRRQSDWAAGARLAGYVTLAELTALFVLRNPVSARVGALVPMLGIGIGYAIGEWPAPPPRGVGVGISRPFAWAVFSTAGCLCGLITCASVTALQDRPPRASFDVAGRISKLSTEPPSRALWANSSLRPLIEYLRACTTSNDRVFAGTFAPDLYFYAGRGFAGGLPVVFGGHWEDLRYQRRSLRLLETQSVPIVITSASKDLQDYTFLWDFITTHYQVVPAGALGDLSGMTVWVKRGLPITGQYGETGLPCYA